MHSKAWAVSSSSAIATGNCRARAARRPWWRRRGTPSRSWARRSATPRSAGASCRLRNVCASSRSTPSASTTWTPRPRPTWASWCAMHRPSRTASASRKPPITFMLSLLKKVAERDADVRAGKWRTQENFAYYVGSRASDGFPGQTIGLVGLGRIGTRVAQLLAPWRTRIIAYDPYVPPAHFLTHGVTAVDYETLLRESDVVSFHVVLTRETRYIFGEKQLKLLKPNAIVINTARGKVLDEKALARAIAENRVRGAAIDAFEEQPLPMDSALRKLGDRVLLSP